MKAKPASKSVKDENLFLFHGDEFLIKQKVSSLADHLLDPEGRTTNLLVLDGSNFDMGDLASHLLNNPLFGGNRLAIVEQTTIFSGMGSISKLLSRVIEAWKASDSKTAFRNLKQIIGLSGVKADGAISDSWLNEIDEISKLDLASRDAIFQAARAFSSEFSGSIKSGDENSIAELLQNPLPSDAYLIFTASAVDKRNRLYKLVEELGVVEELKPRFDRSYVKLDRAYFQKTVRDFLQDYNKTISQDALDLAFMRSGKDLRRIRSELEKLATFVGNRKEITSSDVQQIFSDFHEAAFFDLNRAIRQSDSKQLMAALHENLKVVDHPLQTLAALASEFRKIIVARELLFTHFQSTWKPDLSFDEFTTVAGRVRLQRPPVKNSKNKFDLMGQKDFSLFQLLKTAQFYSLQRLTTIMEAILQADIQIKSSKLGSYSPEIILEHLVLIISNSKNKNSSRIAD
jgi:DNA polymerase III delta subunit